MHVITLDAKAAMNKPITLGAEKTLMDARNTLMRYNISRVVVAKGQRPVGILTEKDIAKFLYSQVPSRRFDEIAVAEIMSKNLLTVNEGTNIGRCAQLMLENTVSSLLVVDSSSNLTGIMTKTDLVQYYVEWLAGNHTVGEFMTKRVQTVAPEETIHMVNLLMSDHKISRIVVTKDNYPIGMITGRDLLPLGAVFGTGTFGRYWTTRQDLVTQRKRQSYIPSGIKAIFIASDLMTPNPLTIHHDADVADAGYIMLRNRISGMPAVNLKGKMTGIITKTDIVKALAVHASGDATKLQTMDDIYASILLASKTGGAKSEIGKALGMSTHQLGRLTAELVDKGMLRVDPRRGGLFTTDKGYAYLKKVGRIDTGR